jgi:glycerol uptake facilitator-like aquaporin
MLNADSNTPNEPLLNKNKHQLLDVGVQEKNETSTESSNDLLKQAVYEMIGTFMFMSVIYYCKGDVAKFVFGFWVILTIFSQLSGAHVNPAVTLGFYIYEQKYSEGLNKLLLFWLAQFLGAFLGATVTKGLFPDVVYVGVPTDQPLSYIMYSEFFFTGTFIFVILWVCSKVTTPSPYSPINCGVIVGWFYFIVNAGAQLSGAAYNPAILAVLNTIAYEVQDPSAIKYLGYMIGSELAGAAVYAYFFYAFFEPFVRRKKNQN